MNRPRYPVYVISKGRHDNPLTANFLLKDGVDFRIVVEPQEADAYKAKVGHDVVLTLPFSNLGLGSIPARNWVWEHSKAAGFRRHWILDDNIDCVKRRFDTMRYRCSSGPAFRCIEDWTDRYENVGIAGMNYSMFVADQHKYNLFALNVHVYSCLLIDNEMPFRWRGRYNEDTDLCLQVLSSGLCTVLFNLFMITKRATLTMKGGNMTTLYQGDGRLKMARALERAWPGVVTVKRCFGRAQHHIAKTWAGFDTPLKRRADVDFDALRPNEYGLELTAVSEVKSPRVQASLDKHQALIESLK